MCQTGRVGVFFIANSSRTMYDVSFSCRYNGKGKVVLMRVATLFFSFLSLSGETILPE